MEGLGWKVVNMKISGHTLFNNIPTEIVLADDRVQLNPRSNRHR